MRKQAGTLLAFTLVFLTAFLTGDLMAKTGKASMSAGDRSFMTEAAHGGMLEVALGQTAQKKAQSQDVKDFGTKMVADHGKANDELKALAQEKNVKLPSKLSAQFKLTVTKLSKFTAGDFDKNYMYEMVKDHAEDVASFRNAEQTVKDPDLKNFITKTLPVLERHFKLAKETAQKVGVDVNKAEREGDKAAEKKKK